MRWAKMAGIAGGVVALYFIDVWLLGSLAAVIVGAGGWITGKADLSLAGWYWSHPFDAAVSWMASGELSHPEVRQTWLLLNLLLGGIALVVYLGSKTRGLSSPLASKSLRLSQDPSHGTAG